VLPAVRAGEIVADGAPRGMGWLRDLPDVRDYTPETTTIAPHLEAIGVTIPEKVALQTKVDLRAYCSPVEDQGALGSFTANAVVGLVEYFERRAHNKHIDASRPFLYKTTRDLLHSAGDTGAYLRTAMGALALFGVPPEEYWPYKIAGFDNEPTAFCYGVAADFRAIEYYRLDPAGTSPSALLTRIKTNSPRGFRRCSGSRSTTRSRRPTRTARSPTRRPERRSRAGTRSSRSATTTT
jgi:hypothetical protein